MAWHLNYFCRMKLRSIQLAAAFVVTTALHAQDKWDIARCVDYALKNNISVRQTDLQSRLSALNYQQNKASQFPNLNFSGSVGYRLGRSENPTTGVLEDNNFLNSGVQLQSQVTLFNWFQIKNTIEASKLTWEADKEQIKKIQNDIALNVAVGYLQVLLAREQAGLAGVQIAQTKSQLENTRKRVDAGSLPELNAAELEAQLARDSSALVTAQTNAQQFLLQLKALLNLDAAADFDIATPPVEAIPVEALADLQPDAVYTTAIATLPQQKVNQLRIQSAQKSVAAAKAGMYPTISAFGSLYSNYVNINDFNRQIGPFQATGAIVTVGGTDYPILAPTVIVTEGKPVPVGRQLRNNFGQQVGIGLNVPIFNGRSARTAWDRSKINVQQLQLEKEQGDMQLKQDIYKAYIDAVAALQKFNADKKTVSASEKAFDFAKKRYELGLLSTYELVNGQNNVQTAKIQALYSQYDYVFKMKLLEFYKGQGLKL